jgi:hypothetical protein
MYVCSAMLDAEALSTEVINCAAAEIVTVPKSICECPFDWKQRQRQVDKETGTLEVSIQVLFV